MKILQIIPNISAGGAERLVVDLCNELAKDNEVFLLTLYDPREEDLFRDDINSSIKTVSISKQLGFDIGIFKRLLNEIKRISPDVIHNHLRSINYLTPLVPFIDAPIIHTIHNDAFKECSNKYVRRLRKTLFKSGRVIPVTISNESDESFEQAYGDISRYKILNGRKKPTKSKNYPKVLEEIAKYKKGANTKVLINIGRIDVQKNQLMLVNAFNKLITEGEDAILLIVGGKRNSPESNDIYKQLKETEANSDRIYILGEKPNATDYLIASDYFCLSSIHEGMPITLIEAFATGKVSVCTPVGGIKSMLNEIDKELLSSDVTEQAYYKALKLNFNRSMSEKENISKKLIASFNKQYSIHACASRYFELFKEVTI